MKQIAYSLGKKKISKIDIPLARLTKERDHQITNIKHETSNITMYPAAAAAAKSLQSCSTLCDPIDGSPPGSPVPGILQARTLA